jgi:hypothetical protein
MATQVIGAGRRSRLYVALVAAALTVAVFVMVAQASSIWSARTEPHVGPAPVQASFSANQLRALARGTRLPDGCWIKYGCQRGTTSARP